MSCRTQGTSSNGPGVVALFVSMGCLSRHTPSSEHVAADRQLVDLVASRDHKAGVGDGLEDSEIVMVAARDPLQGYPPRAPPARHASTAPHHAHSRTTRAVDLRLSEKEPAGSENLIGASQFGVLPAQPTAPPSEQSEGTRPMS